MQPTTRILVVEDDDDVRGLVTRILTDEGYQVEQASTGAGAIEKLHARRTDLLVLDLVIPGIDGWGVLHHVQAMPSPPPVLLLTGNTEYQTFIRAAREGVAAYIEKPFSLRELLATCRSVLESAPASRDSLEAADRRSSPRHVFRVPAEVLRDDQSWRIVGEVHDLSTGGAKLALGTPLPAHDHFRVAFTAPGDVDSLDLESRVQWRVPLGQGFAYGVSFVNVDSSMQHRLQRVLEIAV
jgi:CheY-like chemotaxis protein